MAVELTPLSANNPRIADLRRLLGRRRARTEAGQFVIEGPHVVRELLAAAFAFTEIFIDQDLWENADDRSAIREIARLAQDLDIDVWGVSHSVFAKISDTESPQGVLATAPLLAVSVEKVLQGDGPTVALVDINDPGNAGTILRAAEAFGATGVIFVGDSTDPFGPKAVRAAAGSVCRLPIAIIDSAQQLLDLAQKANVATVASIVAGGVAPEDCDLSAHSMLIFGSEAHGLDESLVSQCQHHLTLPMAKAVDSINVATAASVLLFEVSRQRRSSK